jgi:hypothetical protein
MLRAIALAVFLLAAGPLAVAAQTPSLNWGSEVNPSRCPTDQGYRYLEINVTRQVAGAPVLDESGLVAWATADYNQHIQVWKVGVANEQELFCALVRYQGSFTTLAGSSPAGSDPSIAAGIEGTFEGGYRLVFQADESTSPAYRTRGNIGAFPAPLPFDWLDFYYVNVSPTIPEWWGFVYHGGPNGTWVNSSDGNAGDITD